MKFGRVKIWAGFPRQSFMRQCSEMLWNRLLEIRAWRGYSISSNSGVCCRCYLCKPFCACAECNRSFRGRRSRSPPPCRSFVAIPCISDKLRERQIGKECYFYINVFIVYLSSLSVLSAAPVVRAYRRAKFSLLECAHSSAHRPLTAPSTGLHNERAGTMKAAWPRRPACGGAVTALERWNEAKKEDSLGEGKLKVAGYFEMKRKVRTIKKGRHPLLGET